MKIELDNLRLGHSSLTDKVFAGVRNKKGDLWLHKTDVTGDFISAVISRWENQKETIGSGDQRWEIQVKKLK